MNARQKLHQVNLQEWTVRFADQKTSGLTVRQWCEQNNLSFHTYNYWKHLLKEEVVDQTLPDIVSLSLPVLSDSDSSLETTAPEIRSIRANRAILSNASNIKLQINGVCFYRNGYICFRRVSRQTHQGSVPCLKMLTTVTLQMSTSSVDYPQLFITTITVYIFSKLRIIIILLHKFWLILSRYPSIQQLQIYQHYYFPLQFSTFLSMEMHIYGLFE